VTLKIAVDLAQVVQILDGEEASLSPSGVKNGSSMSLGQDEAIAGGITGVLQVQTQLLEEQHGHDLGDRGT